MYIKTFTGRSSSNYKLYHSQNFLISSEIADLAVKSLQLENSDLVLEIGPGKGFITDRLIKKSNRVIAIELDTNLAKLLDRKYSANKHISIVVQDFLNYKLPQEAYKVFGNIPFAISADIVRRLLNSKNPPELTSLIIQKEFADRLRGTESGKQETFFSLQFKPWFETKVVTKTDRTVFKPMPAVDSELVLISKLKHARVSIVDRLSYLDFIAYGFASNGKNIRASYKKLFTWKQFKVMSQRLGIDFNARITDLSFENWLNLFESYLHYVSREKKEHVLDSYHILMKKQENLFKRNKTNIY